MVEMPQWGATCRKGTGFKDYTYALSAGGNPPGLISLRAQVMSPLGQHKALLELDIWASSFFCLDLQKLKSFMQL